MYILRTHSLPIRVLIDFPTSRKLMILSNGRSAESRSMLVLLLLLLWSRDIILVVWYRP